MGASAACIGFVANAAASQCFFKTKESTTTCARKFGYLGGIDARYGFNVFLKKAFATEMDARLLSAKQRAAADAKKLAAQKAEEKRQAQADKEAQDKSEAQAEQQALDH